MLWSRLSIFSSSNGGNMHGRPPHRSLCVDDLLVDGSIAAQRCSSLPPYPQNVWRPGDEACPRRTSGDPSVCHVGPFTHPPGLSRCSALLRAAAETAPNLCAPFFSSSRGFPSSTSRWPSRCSRTLSGSAFRCARLLRTVHIPSRCFCGTPDHGGRVHGHPGSPGRPGCLTPRQRGCSNTLTRPSAPRSLIVP